MSTPSSIPVWPEDDLPSLGDMLRQVHADYAQYLANLTIEELDRVVDYVNSAGDGFESTVADILTHVAVHAAYHRGQVALLLRDGGHEPNPSDYIAYTRGAPAATRRTG